MALSIFNPAGITRDKFQKYEPQTTYINRINLNDQEETVGIPGLREGLKFVNANDKNDVYYTRVDGTHGYYLVRHYNGVDVPLKVDDTTLVLYHVPEKNMPLTFTGSCLVKPSSRFVANAYTNQTCEQGKKLALLSK